MSANKVEDTVALDSSPRGSVEKSPRVRSTPSSTDEFSSARSVKGRGGVWPVGPVERFESSSVGVGSVKFLMF